MSLANLFSVKSFNRIEEEKQSSVPSIQAGGNKTLKNIFKNSNHGKKVKRNAWGSLGKFLIRSSPKKEIVERDKDEEIELNAKHLN